MLPIIVTHSLACGMRREARDLGFDPKIDKYRSRLGWKP